MKRSDLLYKKLLPVLIGMNMFTIVLGQSLAVDYKPIREKKLPASEVKDVQASFESSLVELKVSNKKAQKDINSSVHELGKSFFSLDSAGLLMEGDTITDYLMHIVNRVQSANPELAAVKFKVFTWRTDEPNASNWGQGMLFVNLDIVGKFDTEAEMAFILCHEMGHNMRKHVLTRIKKTAEMLYDPAFQKEIQRLKKMEYNSMNASKAVFGKFIARYTEHSRENEVEADSLGLLFFCKAGYGADIAIRTIQKLDSIDRPVITSPIAYKKYFDFKEQAFKPSWLEPEDKGGFWVGNLNTLTLPDSLKTHPDCSLRAISLQRITKQFGFAGTGVNKGNVGKDSVHFIARFEMIEFLLSDRQFGFALYNALQLSTVFPNNRYLKCATANCLYEIYVAQTKHQFSQVVEFPDHNNVGSYNEFLVFLQNINSASLKGLAVNWTKNYVSAMNNYSYAGYVNALINTFDKSKEESFSLVKDFGKNYKDDYYAKLLTEKFTYQPKKK